LESAAKEWTAQELFWIVKNGLKFTGMPAWTAPRREDEVWAVVAFLKRLPRLDAEAFRALTGHGKAADRPGRAGSFPQCARCHGDEASPPISDLVPTLGGLSQPYLERALRDYAQGQRPSGIMQPIAAELDEAAIVAMSRHYAQQGTSAVSVRDSGATRESIERGRLIATEGLQARGVPACQVCHGHRAAPAFPQLAGRSARYLAAQLRVFRSGLRDRSGYGAIMAPIARRLADDQVEDVAAYFAHLKPAYAEADENRNLGSGAEGRSP
jgi:cytochrome c553